MNAGPGHSVDEYRYADIGPRRVIVYTGAANGEKCFLPRHLREHKVGDRKFEVSQGNDPLIVDLIRRKHRHRDWGIAELRLAAGCAYRDLLQADFPFMHLCPRRLSPRSSQSDP